MKRNLVIATIAAVALIGGGTATAFAVADDDAPKAAAKTVNVTDRDDDGRDDDADDADDAREDAADARAVREALKGATVDAAEAARAAASHGTVTSVDLDDDGTVKGWEVEVLGKDGKERELVVDLKTGKVTPAPADHDED